MRRRNAGKGATSGDLEIKRVDSWAQYHDLVSGPDYRSWAFRGQADQGWPLYSSLARYLRDFDVDPRAWSAQERRINRVFRRKAHLFLNHVPSDDADFEWLALMQHHGAPTRLLDFTWSPFVAAFFALERATREAAVWAVFVPAIRRVDHQFPEVATPLSTDQLSLRRPGSYEAYYVDNQVAFVSSGEPHLMNQRLIAQSGTFLAAGVLDQPIEEILAGYAGKERKIAKFVLNTKKMRDEALLALYNMNMSHATLFPDLDGLARSMAYELEFHWAYDPKTMKVNPGY